jgi:hypothetical protein
MTVVTAVAVAYAQTPAVSAQAKSVPHLRAHSGVAHTRARQHKHFRAVAPAVPYRSPARSRGLFEWTGWGFGLLSVIAIIIGEYRLLAARRRLRRVAGQVEPSTRLDPPREEPTEKSVATKPTQAQLDDRLRSVLIQLAVDELPFALALDRARRFGAPREDVADAALRLRESELLSFSDPLREDTILRLR